MHRSPHDSRGCVALFCQHPEEERSLLIGLNGGRDDDVGTRREAAAENNLPARGVMGGAEDRAEGLQVLERQVRFCGMDLVRQHRFITNACKAIVLDNTKVLDTALPIRGPVTSPIYMLSLLFTFSIPLLWSNVPRNPKIRDHRMTLDH